MAKLYWYMKSKDGVNIKFHWLWIYGTYLKSFIITHVSYLLKKIFKKKCGKKPKVKTKHNCDFSDNHDDDNWTY